MAFLDRFQKTSRIRILEEKAVQKLAGPKGGRCLMSFLAYSCFRETRSLMLRNIFGLISPMAFPLRRQSCLCKLMGLSTLFSEDISDTRDVRGIYALLRLLFKPFRCNILKNNYKLMRKPGRSQASRILRRGGEEASCFSHKDVNGGVWLRRESRGGGNGP